MRRLLTFTLAGSLLAVLSVAPASAADSFYLSRLESGSRAYSQGDFERAAKELRIACFGLLEEPERLAEGLIRLALAAGRGGDEVGFRDAFERLLEVESNFGAYAAAPVEDAVRRAFEDEVSRRIPARELARSPAFAPLAAAREAARLGELSPKARRAELERRVAAGPADTGALMALARLDAAAGRPKKAVAWLDRLLAAAPDDTAARCLRGGQLTGGSDCAAAIEDLQQCPAASTDPGLAAGLLQCLTRTRRPAEASAFLASLSEELRREPRVARAAGRVPRLEPTAPAAALVAAPAAAEAERPGEQDRLQLAQAAERLRSATRSEDIDAAFELAERLAEELPAWTEAQLLAAELAYLSSRWTTAASYFRRAGATPAERPDLLFYHAVSLFESGAPAEAAEVLERALPRLERTPFVERYVELILG